MSESKLKVQVLEGESNKLNLAKLQDIFQTTNDCMRKTGF